MTDVATRMCVVVPLGSQMWMRCRFGLNVRREMPVHLVPTPPRYFALPRVVMWLPNDVVLPLTSHRRPMGPLLSVCQTFCLAVGLCGLDRWTLPHSSTRSQTLWGGTASLHCGQMLSAGAVSA